MKKRSPTDVDEETHMERDRRRKAARMLIKDIVSCCTDHA